MAVHPGSKTSPKDLSRLGPVGSFVFLWVSSFEWVALEPLFDISCMIPGTCCLSSILGRNNPPKHCLFQGSFKVSRLMERGHQWNCCCFLFWSIKSVCVCVWFPVFFLPRLVPDSLLKLPSRHLDSFLLCDGIISHTEIFHGLGPVTMLRLQASERYPNIIYVWDMLW